jgi:hypothetical protein
VELRGFEPLTFSMPLRRAPSCATAPRSLSALGLANGRHPAATTTRAMPHVSPLRLPGEFGLLALPEAPCQAPTVSCARLSAGMAYYSRSWPLSYLPASGGRGIRTPDLISAIDALSRLSYAPRHDRFCSGAVRNYSRRRCVCQTRVVPRQLRLLSDCDGSSRDG